MHRTAGPALFALLAIALPALAATSPATGPKSEAPKTLTDPPAAGQVIQPADLAKWLGDKKAQQPLVLHVGVASLYKNGHIPGSRYYGPGEEPGGIASLQAALKKVPRDQPLVLYCGCCPWTDCPNVHPAYEAARTMGFKNVRVLYVTKNLTHDWIDLGLPTTKDSL